MVVSIYGVLGQMSYTWDIISTHRVLKSTFRTGIITPKELPQSAADLLITNVFEQTMYWPGWATDFDSF